MKEYSEVKKDCVKLASVDFSSNSIEAFQKNKKGEMISYNRSEKDNDAHDQRFDLDFQFDDKKSDQSFSDDEDKNSKNVKNVAWSIRNSDPVHQHFLIRDKLQGGVNKKKNDNKNIRDLPDCKVAVRRQKNVGLLIANQQVSSSVIRRHRHCEVNDEYQAKSDVKQFFEFSYVLFVSLMVELNQGRTVHEGKNKNVKWKRKTLKFREDHVCLNNTRIPFEKRNSGDANDSEKHRTDAAKSQPAKVKKFVFENNKKSQKSVDHDDKDRRTDVDERDSNTSHKADFACRKTQHCARKDIPYR